MAGRYGTGAAGLVLLLSLAGCRADGVGKASGGSRPATPQQVLEKAVKRLGAVTTYQASVSVSTRVNGTSEHLDGEVASRPKDRTMQFDVPYTVNDDAEDDPEGDTGSTQVLLGDKLYIKDLNLIEVIHKPWISILVSKLKPADPITRVLATMHQTDPLPQARMFTASKDVHTAGRETTGGTSTTRYQGTFALNEALTKLDATERAEAQTVYGSFGATVNFDVWIDDHQLVRQISLVSRLGTKRRLNVTMSYSTFDTPVSITAPPPNEVKNLNDPKNIPA
jgi:hypothetical protein